MKRIYTHIGFAGSRDGCTEPQLHTLEMALIRLVEDHGAQALHHLDCGEADRQAAVAARTLRLRVIGHPPNDQSPRTGLSDETRAPMGHSDRVRAMISEVDLVLACPDTFWPPDRHPGVAWSAIKLSTGPAVILPDGRWRR